MEETKVTNGIVPIKAGLILDIGLKGKFTHIAHDEVQLPVSGYEIIHSKQLEEVHRVMKRIAHEKSDGQPHLWRLHMAHGGRCWVIEGGTEIHCEGPELSFYDYPTEADWNVAGIEVK